MNKKSRRQRKKTYVKCEIACGKSNSCHSKPKISHIYKQKRTLNDPVFPGKKHENSKHQDKDCYE